MTQFVASNIERAILAITGLPIIFETERATRNHAHERVVADSDFDSAVVRIALAGASSSLLAKGG